MSCKKLDEETALNEQLLAASQDEEKDAKQELRDKEQELEQTAAHRLVRASSAHGHELRHP